jgi:hypothetical protein
MFAGAPVQIPGGFENERGQKNEEDLRSEFVGVGVMKRKRSQ